MESGCEVVMIEPIGGVLRGAIGCILRSILPFRVNAGDGGDTTALKAS